MILLGEKGDPGPPGPTGTNGTNGGTGYFISCSTVKTSNSFHQLFSCTPDIILIIHKFLFLLKWFLVINIVGF